MLWIQNVGRLFSTRNLSQPTLWKTYWLKFSRFRYWVVGSPVVKDVVEDLEDYLENIDYLKSLTTFSLKRCRWFQIINMLNYRQIWPKRNCSTLAIPWCFYRILRAFDGISTSIIWQKYHPPELKHRLIFLLLSSANWRRSTSPILFVRFTQPGDQHDRNIRTIRKSAAQWRGRRARGCRKLILRSNLLYVPSITM